MKPHWWDPKDPNKSIFMKPHWWDPRTQTEVFS